jgi:hypothetical protein
MLSKSNVYHPLLSPWEGLLDTSFSCLTVSAGHPMSLTDARVLQRPESTTWETTYLVNISKTTVQ